MLTLRDNWKVFLFIFLVIGGLLSLLIISITEKKRLGGRLFSHIPKDIMLAPVPALLGYSGALVFGWLSVISFLLDSLLRKRKEIK